MQALTELPSPTNTLTALQLFYNSVEGHIRSLQSLETPQEQYTSMLVPTILKKLSAEVLRNLTRSRDGNQWTLSELQRAILQEVHILEMGTNCSTSKDSQDSHHIPMAAFITNTGKQQMYQESPKQQSDQPKQQSEQSKQLSCVYCREPHTPVN